MSAETLRRTPFYDLQVAKQGWLPQTEQKDSIKPPASPARSRSSTRSTAASWA